MLVNLILEVLTRALGGAIAVTDISSPQNQARDDVELTLPRAIENSNVPGKAFNHIFQIWLENSNFEAAANDENMRWVAEQGILLRNYYAVTHPSQPNYIATVGGETFGLQDDGYHHIPANISTVIDLLDTKKISWAAYQEDLPDGDFKGTSSNGYVRKHNPLASYDSISSNSTRTSHIQNFTSFQQDLENNKLPQWAFFTPNIRNDGHDTGIAYGGKWLRGWLEPLLKNDKFFDDTLIVVSFDETEQYNIPNRVFTVLLGGAVHSSLHNTTDSMYYNHYSTLSTVSVNWNLPSLGRWDCDANVFSFVADKVGYKNTNISYNGLRWNASYPGPLNNKESTPGWWPKPDTEAHCVAGQGALQSIKLTWGTSMGSYNYTNVYPYDENYEATRGGEPAIGANDASSTTVPSDTAPSNSASASGTENCVCQADYPGLSHIFLFTGFITILLS